MELEEKKQEIIDWIKTPPAERKKSKRGLAQSLGVGVTYIDELETEESLVELGGYDSEKWLRGRTLQMDKALTAACEKWNAAALKIYYQITHRLVDLSETKVKISLDADELARINAEADRRAREFRKSDRVENLQERPPLLPNEIREDKG